MLRSLAFTLFLYNGQMCVTTQNLWVPRGGIAADEGHKSVDQVGEGLAAAVTKRASEPCIATSVLGVGA